MDAYPALTLLLSGYLNQDWADDYPDAWAAVDDFSRSEPDAWRVADEIRALLASVPDEDATERLFLRDLGSGYLPEADGWTCRAWLSEVSRRVMDQFG